MAPASKGKPGPELHYKRVGAVSTAVYEAWRLRWSLGTQRAQHAVIKAYTINQVGDPYVI